MKCEWIGDDVVVQELGTADRDEAWGILSQPMVSAQLGKGDLLTPERFERKFMCEPKRLRLFRIVDSKNRACIAYAGTDDSEGTPYLIFYWDNIDFDTISETLVQRFLAPLFDAYFEDKSHESVLFFVPAAHADNMADQLEMWGFERLEDYPTLDPTEEVGFVLPRAAYEGIYGYATND